MSKPNLYKADGVDVEAGDSFSAHAGEVCRGSFGNSPYIQVDGLASGHFRGARCFRFHHLPRHYGFDMTSDGNGTKVVLTAAAGMYRSAARDLLAMSAMDLTRNGGLGLVFNNVLDVASLGEPGTPTHQAFIELIGGLGEAARRLKVVLFRGETAELSCCISSENPGADVKFNWSGTMLGVYHKRQMISGDALRSGMIVMALKENGFRANGISSVRKALALRFGVEWWANPEAMPYIQAAAEPSVLYDPFFQYLNGWYEPDFQPKIKVHSIIHLSGGAFESKFGKDVLFPRGLSAELDNLRAPPVIMRDCADWRGMDDDECYRTWNGGQGALAVISSDDQSFFLDTATRFGIDAAFCGLITRRADPIVRIRSMFTGKEIIYRAA